MANFFPFTAKFGSDPLAEVVADTLDTCKKNALEYIEGMRLEKETIYILNKDNEVIEEIRIEPTVGEEVETLPITNISKVY